MSVEQTKTAFVAKATASAVPKSDLLVAHKASEPESDWLKILAFAHSGAGKSYALAGLLECGLRIFVANTDIGGDGLRSVKQALRAKGKAELLENLGSYDFTDYKTFNKWLNNPNIVQVEGKPLWDWNPDVFAWEGISNWQERHLGDYILLENTSQAKESADLREAGLMADQQDWGAVRKGTLRALDKFLITHNPNGKKIHKYVTSLEDASKADKLTGEIYKGPLIMGAARSYMAPAFDLIVEMQAPKGKDGKYQYKCGASNSLSKKRGLPVEAVEDADMEKLWRKITAA